MKSLTKTLTVPIIPTGPTNCSLTLNCPPQSTQTQGNHGPVQDTVGVSVSIFKIPTATSTSPLVPRYLQRPLEDTKTKSFTAPLTSHGGRLPHHQDDILTAICLDRNLLSSSIYHENSCICVEHKQTYEREREKRSQMIWDKIRSHDGMRRIHMSGS